MMMPSLICFLSDTPDINQGFSFLDKVFFFLPSLLQLLVQVRVTIGSSLICLIVNNAVLVSEMSPYNL